MKIFIAVGMPYGDDEMVVEVVDDMDCFSPSLLGKYPITEMESENLHTAPQDYARKHKLTPIRLVHNTSHGSYDDMWAFEDAPKTHQVRRVDHFPYVLITEIVPKSPWLFDCYYDLEGVVMSLEDAKRAAIRINKRWDYDSMLAKSAGLWDEDMDRVQITVARHEEEHDEAV